MSDKDTDEDNVQDKSPSNDDDDGLRLAYFLLYFEL